jgi:hypothetical protein
MVSKDLWESDLKKVDNNKTVPILVKPDWFDWYIQNGGGKK